MSISPPLGHSTPVPTVQNAGQTCSVKIGAEKKSPTHRTPVRHMDDVDYNEIPFAICVLRLYANLKMIHDELLSPNERAITEFRRTWSSGVGPGFILVVLSTLIMAWLAELTNVKPSDIALALSWYTTFPCCVHVSISQTDEK